MVPRGVRHHGKKKLSELKLHEIDIRLDLLGLVDSIIKRPDLPDISDGR
jgi:hypothetical protein